MRQPGRSSRPSTMAIVSAALLVALGVVSTVVPATPARAAIVACTPSFDVVHRVAGVPEFAFQRCGVPDYDQIRAALPSNGSMYCAPTSAIDWAVYLADRGARSVMPGTSAANTYANIDQAIASMGKAMGTNPTTGTQGGAVAGLVKWFDQSYAGRGGDYFTVHEGYGFEQTRKGVTRVDRPSGSSLAAAAASGSLVMPHVVWYELNAAGWMTRKGSHTVALASAKPDLWTSFGAYTLGFVDPASVDPANNYTNTQGEFAVDLRPVRPTVIKTGPSTFEHLDKIWGPDYSTGYLNGAIFITPKFGLFPDPSAGRMTLRRTVQLDEGPGDRVIDGLDGRVIDIALHADGASTTMLLDEGRLLTVNNLDGTTSTTSTLPGATNIVLDDKGRTAAIDSDGRITLMDRHHNPITSVHVAGATGLGFSQVTHELVTFDSAHQELVALAESADGGLTLRRQPLKPDGPPIAPDATLSVNPRTGVAGLLAPGSSTLTRSLVTGNRFVGADSITIGDGAPLDGLVADATGAWYSTRAGEIVAFDIDGHELPDNPFAGQPSASIFEIFQPVDIGTRPEVLDLLPQDTPNAGDRLSLDQASASEAVGVTHDVAVTLTNVTGGPLPGRPVAFAVAGANATTGTAVTDAAGQATLSWLGTTPGEDVLTAWVDTNGNGTNEPDEAAASIGTTWTEPAGITTATSLTTSANPSRPNQRVTFTATVTAPGSAETPQGTIQFTGNGVNLGPPVPLAATGTAAHTTRSLPAGVHRIEATFTPADASRFFSSSSQLDQFVGSYRSTGNLIRNPGADDEPGSSTGDVVPVPSWPVDTGGFTAVQYGAVDPETGLPFPTAGTGPPDAGPNFFAGGSDNTGSIAVQVIPLAANLLPAVDAGTARYRFAAWLGGFEDQNDLCEPVVLFTDEAGAPLDRGFLIGGQAADRNNETKLLPYATGGQVPVGARTAHVALIFSRTHGVYNDGYCDSLVLDIATPR